MPTLKKRISFFESEEGAQTRGLLESMVEDARFNTDSSYSANSTNYPDNLIPFVDKHMNYLNVHPAVDSVQYLANLRLITRFR